MPESFYDAVTKRLVDSVKKPEAKYNVPRLTSYAGYPVVTAKDLGLEKYFATDGKEVGGMAWGGETNPVGQGKGEPPSIVPNPNYFKNNPRGQNALTRLEGSRHWMSENSYIPKFEITPEMKQWREKFKTMGEAGHAYATDDNAFRQTIISRIIGEDQTPVSPEAIAEAEYVNKFLEEQDRKATPKLTDVYKSATFQDAVEQRLAPPPPKPDYGNRPDGTKKGKGWLGEIKLDDGSVATEYTTQSDAVQMNGKRVDFPTLVPTLIPDEIEALKKAITARSEIPEPIMQKAIQHARKRLSEGKSVFADE